MIVRNNAGIELNGLSFLLNLYFTTVSHLVDKFEQGDFILGQAGVRLAVSNVYL